MNKNGEIKAISFADAIMNTYRDEESREYIRKIELDEDNLNEDFISMLQAIFAIYVNITGDKKIDLIGFTHLLNRLAFQFLKEDN